MQFRIPSYRLLATQTVVCFFLVLSSGCTYLHQPQKDALAKETSEEFKKFQEKSADLYTAMLANLQLTESRVSEVQDKISQQKEISFGNRIHFLTWGQIRRDLEERKEEEENRQRRIAADINKLLKEMEGFEGKGKDAAAGLELANTRLKTAIKQENDWQAQVALFRGTIPLVFQASKDEKLDVKKLKEGKDQVLGQTVEVREIKDGKLDYTPKTVGEVLDSHDLIPLLKNYTFNIFNPAKAPGLTVTILSLALDLAKAERDRAKLRVDYLHGLIEALGPLKERRLPGYKIKALNDLNFLFKQNLVTQDETVLATFIRLRTQRKTMIPYCARILASYAIVTTLEESEILKLQSRPAILEHEYSIKLSAINSREHEALIARGLEGLAIYYKGGIKPETIANFLRAAQAVALAIIGAGVL